MFHLIKQIPHLPCTADAVESHRICKACFRDLLNQVLVIITFQRIPIRLNSKHDDDESVLCIIPDILHGLRNAFRRGVGLKDEVTDPGIDKLPGNKGVFFPGLAILQSLDGPDIPEDLRIIAFCRFPCHSHRFMNQLMNQHIVSMTEHAVGIIGIGQDRLAAGLQILPMDILHHLSLLQHGKLAVLTALPGDGGKIGPHGSVHEQHTVFDLFSYIHESVNPIFLFGKELLCNIR